MNEEKKPRVVKGMESVKLSEQEFRDRFMQRFYDPAFDAAKNELDVVMKIAWKTYDEYHKSPRTKKAGHEFADPEFQLPIEWLETRNRIKEAEAARMNPNSRSRILVINAAARSDQTCPGEMSKTYRLAQIAKETIQGEQNFEVDFLDLSRLASEYGKMIYPCKACVQQRCLCVIGHVPVIRITR